ncbi:hypothetical protein TrLO_g9576 [Triparma laevis f. longispina]|uniref:Uncharacterized protein n=1 Tax=Triparma laevis f. longispina TaxID=1714387 RepID=A0A9W6ZE52_9STRA|nr:hypothetical protein TrLO_g9576 [Triparma laevis f. longispina]
MERTGPSPRRPPVKRTTTERSPHPSQQQSQHQFLASATQKRHDNRVSPSTRGMNGVGAVETQASTVNTEDSKSRTGKQKKFLSG